MTATNNKHKAKRIVLRIVLVVAILFALCAAAAGINRVFQMYFNYNNIVFTGYGFNASQPIEVITPSDLKAVENVLDNNNISYKVKDDGTMVLVQGLNWEKAYDALQNSGYEFIGDVI